jgi:hypothetical protein
MLRLALAFSPGTASAVRVVDWLPSSLDICHFSSPLSHNEWGGDGWQRLCYHSLVSPAASWPLSPGFQLWLVFLQVVK